MYLLTNVWEQPAASTHQIDSGTATVAARMRQYILKLSLAIIGPVLQEQCSAESRQYTTTVLHIEANQQSVHALTQGASWPRKVSHTQFRGVCNSRCATACAQAVACHRVTTELHCGSVPEQHESTPALAGPSCTAQHPTHPAASLWLCCC